MQNIKNLYNELMHQSFESPVMSVHSLPQTTLSHLKIKLWRSEIFNLAPRKTQAGEHEVVIPAFPQPCQGGLGEGEGGHKMT